jgi:AraC family transcriptional regulator of adaptative response / DNA-3-methyladenine glycosylase II
MRAGGRQDGAVTTTSAPTGPVHRDAERCYRAVASRDPRFDGIFFTGVRTTGIYCRPSCPAITPKRSNVSFHPTAAAAHAAGYRACKRCLPDATPGSPEWDVRADVVGQTMRLIRDGVVEREGVAGLAMRLGYSERHLTRLLTAELGAGPLAIARSRRAQAARVLVETTELGLADVAFAAGFASVRQFNDTMQEVYASTPSAMRGRAHGRSEEAPARSGRLRLRLAVREPFDAPHVLGFLTARAASGIEHVAGGTYSRVLRLPHGAGRVHLTPGPASVQAELELDQLRDLATAVQRCRALLDLDADPSAVVEILGADPALRRLVEGRPGTRMPGAVDGFELAVRAVLGQQVSVTAATRLVARIVEEHGDRLSGDAQLHSTFPSPQRLAEADPSSFGMPASRGRALVELARQAADGRLSLEAGADRAETERALLAVPGVGPWTAGYIAMRALGDPDRFLPGDVVVRNAMASLGLPGSGAPAAAHAARWRPWRSYAVMHLWRSAAEPSAAEPSAAEPHEETP